MLQKKRKYFFKVLHLDVLGAMASALCAFHCAALPFLLGLGFFAKLHWMMSHTAELVFLAVSILLVGFSLGRSYGIHKNFTPLLLALLGFMTFGVGHILVFPWNGIISGLGGAMIAYSHFKNWRLTHSF